MSSLRDSMVELPLPSDPPGGEPMVQEVPLGDLLDYLADTKEPKDERLALYDSLTDEVQAALIDLHYQIYQVEPETK